MVAGGSGSGLAETFMDVARTLLAERGEQHTLNRVAQLAVATVDGCDHAGISLVGPQDQVSTRAASDEVPVRVDAIQYQTGEGPCLSAIRDATRYRTGDLASEDRWPAFTSRAVAETGVRSVLSVRLFADEDVLGALSLYSRRVGAFDEQDCAVAVVFAAHAAIALVNARAEQQVEELGYAMSARGLIGQAIGILMVQSRLTGEQAFALLRGASQRENVKLRDLAARIVTRQETRARDQPRS